MVVEPIVYPHLTQFCKADYEIALIGQVIQPGSHILKLGLPTFDKRWICARYAEASRQC